MEPPRRTSHLLSGAGKAPSGGTPGRFNIQTLHKRLDAVGDLFAPALKTKQKLP